MAVASARSPGHPSGTVQSPERYVSRKSPPSGWGSSRQRSTAVAMSIPWLASMSCPTPGRARACRTEDATRRIAARSFAERSVPSERSLHGDGPAPGGRAPGRPVRADPAATAGGAAAAAAVPLVAALVAGQPVQDQQDQGAGDGADDPRGAEVMDGEGVVFYQVQDEPAEEGPQHAKDDRPQQPDGVAAGDEQARQRPGDESHDQQDDDECQHARHLPL